MSRELTKVFPLRERAPGLHREFSAALCLGGGAVKRDVGREVERKRWKEGRKEGSEPATTDRGRKR